MGANFRAGVIEYETEWTGREGSGNREMQFLAKIVSADIGCVCGRLV